MIQISKCLGICVLIQLLLLRGPVLGQTRPQQSLYLMNYSFLNPAITGVNDYADIRGGLRRQWVGVSGAPAINWLSGNIPFGKKIVEKTITGSNDLQTFNNNRASVMDRGHGMGFTLYQSSIGPYRSANLGISYAYHLPVADGAALSMGVSAGFGQVSYDPSKNIYPDMSLSTSYTAAMVSRKIVPDLNAGVLFYANRFFAGISFLQITAPRYIDTIGSDSRIKPQSVTSAGYSFKLDDFRSRLLVSATMKTDFTNPIRYDLIAKLHFKEIGWGGINFRNQDALGIFFGCNVSLGLSFTYMYENHIVSNQNLYNNSSHELMFAFRFLKKGQAPVSKIDW